MAKGERKDPGTRNSETSAAEWVELGKLIAWDSNPRKNDEAVSKVAESIRRWGFAAPIVARRENLEVIAGHTRLKAAKKLGLQKVPVRLVDLSEDEAHKLAVADNRLAEEAAWDKAVLGPMLAAWQDDDIGALGFDDDELDRLTGSNYQSEVREVDVARIQATFWVSVTGPLPNQPAVLDELKRVLTGIEGVDVQVTTSAL